MTIDWRERLHSDKPEWSHEANRAMIDEISDYVQEWQGFPVPLPDLPLMLNTTHALRPILHDYDYQARHEAGVEFRFHVGGPNEVFESEVIVNSWFNFALNVTVHVYHGIRKDGSVVPFVIKELRSPDGSMDRLTMWMTTIGASDAWDHKAERTARSKLRGMLTERQYRHYDLTGSFFETSERSGVTYLFRRLRPTVAMSAKGGKHPTENMHCLAVLCMHPIGYYARSWGGCMVPSDDVIAHLSFMRSDEARYWGVANQHEAWRPEAGL